MRIRILVCMLLLVSVAAAQGAKSGSPKQAKPSAAANKPENAQPTTATADAPAVRPALVETFLKRVYGFNQDIAFKVIDVRPSDAQGVYDAVVVASSAQGQQLIHFYVLPDGKHVVMGELVPFGADPFAANRAKLASESFGPTKGPKDAPIMIVEFADLQCPACKAAQQDMEKLQNEFPQAKFVFQSFPLDMHPWANLAARYLNCIGKQSNDKALSFIQTVFIHQGDIAPENAKEKLERYAGMVGADAGAAGTCAESSEAKDRVAQSIVLGKSMKITGTPSVFINGHPAILSDYDHLKAMVDFELAQAK